MIEIYYVFKGLSWFFRKAAINKAEPLNLRENLIRRCVPSDRLK